MNTRTEDAALTAVFAPSGICVIGASDRRWSYGRRTIENLVRHGFGGPIIPVNPRYAEVAGLRCLSSVSALPAAACDLAVVLVRGDRIPGLLDELAETGVRAAIVFSSPPEERTMRIEVQEAVRRTGIRVLGFGASVVSTSARLAAGGFSAAWSGGLTTGPVALISQSGGVSGSALNYFIDAGTGIRWIASVGSVVDVSVAETLSWMRLQGVVSAIGLFLEGDRHGDELVEELFRLRTDGIRVVAIKVGATEMAQQVAATHTGIATGDDRIWNEVFRQAGVIRVDDVSDMCSLLDGFGRAGCKAVSSAARSGFVAASVGSAGGAAVAADSLARAGVRMLQYTPEERAEIARHLPSGSPTNPLDIAGVKGLPDEEVQALRELLQVWSDNPRVAGALVVSPAMGFEAAAAQAVGEAWDGAAKPIAVAWIAGSMADPGRLLLKRLGVPGFDRVDLAARFLRALQDGGQVELVPDRQPAAGPIENLASGEDAIATLRQAGISFPARRLLAIDEAEQLAGSLPHVPEPWAVKIEVAGVAHKARLGGVILHEYPSPALVEKVDLALEKIRRQGLDPVSIVVEQFIANAVELFAAVLRDETFGLVALLGMGGTRVDYLPRPTLHLGIPTPADTLDLLRRSGVADELDTSPISAEAAARPLHDLFAALVEVMADPRLTSVELNPIVMTDTPPAVIALDAVVVKTSLRRDPNESEVAACSMPSM